MSDPIRPALTADPNPSRTPDRTRPYLPEPPVPPDYGRFCEVHTRHRQNWSLTYAPGQPAPYRAHHRQCDGIALAAADLDSLDLALTAFAPPPRTRPYLPTPDRPAAPLAAPRPARVVDSRDARCLHQLADDLAASTSEHSYWTSAVRDASLEMLARIAALLGDACALPVPEPAPASPACPTAHHPLCLRPAAHDGHHLDALGRTWAADNADDAEENAR
ncbi:hypothetical protein FZ103_22660 [Streptomonospora sp. PA3]|uniref:hypothetical protein n=1 Tax=Streptomonospora sp. PA3 TaxID=2607326 RepID=UPI0012DD93AD|nr:hypothetical protein [Streptomonospora sp. PA3]MUL43928.1 hypothetical protein [Streptomonospora sp. PA3]